MPYRIDVDPSGILVLRLLGQTSQDEIVASFRDVASHEAWRPRARVLVDMSACDTAVTPSSEVRDRALAFADRADMFAGVRCGVAAPDPAAFGVSRMWQGIVETQGVSMRIEVFKTFDEARAWLTSEEDDSASG